MKQGRSLPSPSPEERRPRVSKTIMGLLICLGLAGAAPVFAQETTLYSTAESGGGYAPPRWEIGCAYAMSGHGSDVSVTVTLTWDAAGSGGSQTHSESSYGYLSSAMTTFVNATVNDMTVTCDAMFTFSTFNQVIFRQTSAVVPGLRPYAYAASDTGNWGWQGLIRRDIWYQILNSDSSVWHYGGLVNEQFYNIVNPCGVTFEEGIGATVDGVGRFLDTYYTRLNNPPRPGCAYSATQRYTLDTAFNRTLLEQGWRWDTSGVWKTW